MCERRTQKKIDLERGVASPDMRDVDDAAAEAMRRVIARQKKIDTAAREGYKAIPMSPAHLMLGILIRDGFDRDKAVDRIREWGARVDAGPSPLMFLRAPRADVWEDWNAREAREAADRSSRSVATLDGLEGASRRH